MARNTVPVNLSRMHLTKQEKAERLAKENQLRGRPLDQAVPEELTEAEAAAYIWLQTVLEPADILGEPDRETVKLTAIAIARLEMIDDMIRKDPELLTDKNINAIRKKYIEQYFSLCGELCLSPAARCKISELARNKKLEDPLINLLGPQK